MNINKDGRVFTGGKKQKMKLPMLTVHGCNVVGIPCRDSAKANSCRDSYRRPRESFDHKTPMKIEIQIQIDNKYGHLRH